MVQRFDDNATLARKYRERAEQLRRIAEDVRGDANRDLLLEVAADYEKLADDSPGPKHTLPPGLPEFRNP